MPRKEFYVSRPYVKTVEAFIKMCKREGISPSKVVCRLIREYVEKKWPGNPQKPLIEDAAPPVAYSLAPVVRRKQVIDDLKATVKRNPGCNVHRLTAKFSEASGLRRVTIQEYIRTLVQAGSIRMVGSRVYPR